MPSLNGMEARKSAGREQAVVGNFRESHVLLGCTKLKVCPSERIFLSRSRDHSPSTSDLILKLAATISLCCLESHVGPRNEGVPHAKRPRCCRCLCCKYLAWTRVANDRLGSGWAVAMGVADWI